MVEVGTEHDDHAVDARLDLATEERLAGVLPTAVVSDLCHRPAHLVEVGVDTEVVKADETVCSGGPGLALGLLAAIRSSFPSREQRATHPLAVFALQGQQPGTPPFGRHSGALRRDDLCRRVDKIAQYLPADGGVGVEQPIHHSHRPSLRSPSASVQSHRQSSDQRRLFGPNYDAFE